MCDQSLGHDATGEEEEEEEEEEAVRDSTGVCAKL